MGVSKVVIIDPNTQTPDVLMDVTGDDTSAGVLLAGNVGTRNDGEKVTGTIPEKTSSDLTVSGATVTAPAGHYASNASATVASGTAGTPTATKGSVSNHSVNVTPSVTNTSGYISGGTQTGTPVSVSASELVSGTKSIAANGTGIDVTNYESVDVAVPPTPLQTKSVTPTESAQTVTPDSGYALSQVNVGAIDSEYVGSDITRRSSSDLTFAENRTTGTPTVTAPAGYYDDDATKVISMGTITGPTITKGTVSNHTMPLTASIINTGGYFYPATTTTSGTSVSASELVSGTKSISENGTGIDVTNYAAVDVNVATPAPGLEYALCFSSPSSFTLATSYGRANWDDTIEWTDGVQAWAVWDGTTTLTASSGVLYLRGTGNGGLTGAVNPFVLTGTNISCDGNIETLLDYATVALGNHPTMNGMCYAYLFQNCTGLISAPNLPATTLEWNCYEGMFSGCTNLTSAPVLPATILDEYCYYSMFEGCTSLTSTPALPATTLYDHCYYSMFRGCTSLTSAPALPATTLADYCYDSMFENCTSLTSAPALPATTLAQYCYRYMFQGCTSLTSAPALPAMTLPKYCYGSMFKDCTSLVSPPKLPATTLDTYCYYYMFFGCTHLTSIPVLPATTLKDSCYYRMFYNCTSIKVSTTYNSTSYPYAFRIPESGTGTTATNALNGMFTGTGGSFTGNPTINTVYYLDKPLPVDFTVDGDATSSDILPGKISYANGSRVVGNIATKAAATITPTTSDQTIAAGTYLTGAQTIVGDANLIAANIKKGVQIFGITGECEMGSNRNLLDNWYFINPVNQRGQTAYTGGYSIDRWKLLNNSGTLNVVSGGIQFTNTTSGYGYCVQKNENVNYNTTPCTFSVLTSTGDLYTGPVASQMFSLPSGLYFYKGASDELAIRIPANLTAENSEIIAAMKIEIGAIQTLAHKENGVWVPNEIPHFAEELAKCQRYFLKLSGQSGTYCRFGTANAYSATIAMGIIPLPVTMRTATPTLSFGNIYLQSGQAVLSASSFAFRGLCANTLYVDIGVASGLTTGAMYLIKADHASGSTVVNDGYLTVSCDF